MQGGMKASLTEPLGSQKRLACKPYQCLSDGEPGREHEVRRGESEKSKFVV